MKKLLTLFLVCYTCSSSAQPVDSLRHIIDIAIAKMKANALHRNEVDWVDFEQKVYQETKGISNLDTLLNRFPLFFKWINDFHGAISMPGKWISWEDGKEQRKTNSQLDSALRKGPYLQVKRWGDVGYFRVPGGITKNIPRVIQMLVDSLCQIDPISVKGWIIDLRLNTGGNIWFMLPPLATMIGDGVVGGTKYLDDRPDNEIKIQNGRPYGNGQFYDVPNKECELPNASVPVVVLVGPATASSGEGLMLAFKGRPNTFFIGEQTAGFITSNNSFELNSVITLNLATSYMKDRTGAYYTEGIHPDLFIKDGDNFDDLMKDKKVCAAIAWLKKKATFK